MTRTRRSTFPECLARGGVLVAPVGWSPYGQSLERFRKGEDGGVRVEDLGLMTFVPMVHQG